MTHLKKINLSKMNDYSWKVEIVDKNGVEKQFMIIQRIDGEKWDVISSIGSIVYSSKNLDDCFNVVLN